MSRPLARVIGAPFQRLSGTTGRLARDNAMRNPKRTASTAAALMIGLTMVATVSVLAASLKASTSTAVDRTARAEIIVQQVGPGAGLSPAVAQAMRGQPGVAAVSEIGNGRAKVAGGLTFLATVDPATVARTLDLGVRSGSIARLDGETIFVHDARARAMGWRVGSTVPVEWGQTGASTLRVAGTFAEKGAVNTDYLVANRTYDRHVDSRLDGTILVKTEKGESVRTVQDRLITATAAWPNAEVLTAKEFKDSVASQVNKFLAFVVALLLLAVIIALLGIVNTLALSVFERTRELGLLRAVGMTRRQVRTMVRWESVIIAVIGAASGALLGTVFGVALTKALGDDGVETLEVPITQLLLYVACAAAAGVLAAIGPARSAAKVDVLHAVVIE